MTPPKAGVCRIMSRAKQSPSKNPDITFFLSRLGSGGIGRLHIHLIKGLREKGLEVDLALGKLSGPYRKYLDFPGVYNISTTHSLLGVLPFALYLMRRRPKVVVCEKLRVNVVAQRAKRLAGSDCRIFASIHGPLTHKLEHEGLSEKKRQKKYALIRKWYPNNDGFIAVSRGIGEDLHHHFHIPKRKIHVIYNPVLAPEVMEKGQDAPTHPWFNPKANPVILSVGRLEEQKGYPCLLESFLKVRQFVDCRLIILGEGSKRKELQSIINKLGLQEHVSMPGFVSNPYPFMRCSDLFVLSSKWEGFGIVLVEAMAFGTPVVSTDCPVGPGEILEQGKLGKLVPVDDTEQMAKAIIETLRARPPSEPLIQAARKYTVERVAEAYLNVLGFGDTPGRSSNEDRHPLNLENTAGN